MLSSVSQQKDTSKASNTDINERKDFKNILRDLPLTFKSQVMNDRLRLRYRTLNHLDDTISRERRAFISALFSFNRPVCI